MSIAETAYRHIVLDDNGFPAIDGANTKVVELHRGDPGPWP